MAAPQFTRNSVTRASAVSASASPPPIVEPHRLALLAGRLRVIARTRRQMASLRRGLVAETEPETFGVHIEWIMATSGVRRLVVRGQNGKKANKTDQKLTEFPAGIQMKYWRYIKNSSVVYESC